ncbi:MAG: hypothetical protein M3Q96_08915 [Pseudomonadota bacterium]|nr:hypothetical protein [Pseudomonadota bacterium]
MRLCRYAVVVQSVLLMPPRVAAFRRARSAASWQAPAWQREVAVPATAAVVASPVQLRQAVP